MDEKTGRKRLRVAVIGCGSIANAAHIPNYVANEGVEIKYFCDIIPERAEKAVKKYACGKAVTDYHDFLKDPELDAVSVCTHNDMHAPISIDFLRAGKDVLCEKPAARTLPEALEMQRIAHETGRLLVIGVVNRFGAYNNLVKKMIARGDLGEVYHVFASFRRYRGIPGLGGDFTRKACSGGGVLIDIGVHNLDVILYCCGEPKPVTASGEAYCRLGRDIAGYTYLDMWAADSGRGGDRVYDVDDFVTGLVRTTGPTITFEGAWAQNIGDENEKSFIDFLGDKGGIRMNYTGDFTYYSAQDGALTAQKFSMKSEDFYKTEINAFVASCLEGAPNQAHIDYAVQTSKIMDAIYRSSEQHREIVLD
ncbi:MAG: Gfo/Idh/MocA family oxidoreductase [Oscillospiraceae bacterium]|jgi:predicted dehydrogenase|nr:Gfo/Idh/MocA family oxidoreductase [Oscillospiraceae bacterium]